jgi:hypothetical protein
MDEHIEIVTPHEAKIESLLQLLAVLLDKLGGEVVISRRDIEMLEGVQVVGHAISKDYVVFRLAEEDEGEDTEVIDLDEEIPPNTTK